MAKVSKLMRYRFKVWATVECDGDGVPELAIREVEREIKRLLNYSHSGLVVFDVIAPSLDEVRVVNG